MYEASFILKEEDTSSVKAIFFRHGAEISGDENPGKIRLAYPVKNTEYGYFSSFRFSAPSENLKKIFDDLKLEEGVFRYLITKAIASKTEAREEGKTPGAAAVYKKQEEPKHHPEPVLTNEELEKKIEEILQ
ncbi:MAG: 30S ribosomal protein S6 [Candidatus Brennerbacteria bacterium]|nr:30S ribosomal protein S6 [Candidatus Brennerbacteria bacterium]